MRSQLGSFSCWDFFFYFFFQENKQQQTTIKPHYKYFQSMTPSIGSDKVQYKVFFLFFFIIILCYLVACIRAETQLSLLNKF